MHRLTQPANVLPEAWRKDAFDTREAVEQKPQPPLACFPEGTLSQWPWQPCKAVGRVNTQKSLVNYPQNSGLACKTETKCLTRVVSAVLKLAVALFHEIAETGPKTKCRSLPRVEKLVLYLCHSKVYRVRTFKPLVQGFFKNVLPPCS